MFGDTLSLADVGLLEVLLYCIDYFGDGILEEFKPLKVMSPILLFTNTIFGYALQLAAGAFRSLLSGG